MSTIQGVTLNTQQNLFVIPAGEGFSCMGFDYLFEQLSMLAKALKVSPPQSNEKGTLEQFRQYRNALTKLSEIGGIKATWYALKTPVKVKTVLERYRKSEDSIRLFYGDTKTGKDWMEECDVKGEIARTGGLLKAILLISEGEYGGPSVLTDCIVKMQDAETGEILYQHKDYYLPKMELLEANKEPGLPFEVHTDGKVHARFSSIGKASQWIAFMTGDCMSQP